MEAIKKFNVNELKLELEKQGLVVQGLKDWLLQYKKTTLFADDTNLFYSHNIKELFRTVNAELSHLNDWSCANKWSLNTDKTKYVLFHKAKSKDNLPLVLPDLFINDAKINRENSLKFLGVAIGENLDQRKDIGQMKAFYQYRIPEPSYERKETADIDILITSRNGDRKITQSIKITIRPPLRKRMRNQLSQFRWTSTKVIPTEKT